jgi:zinc protease
VPSIAPPQKITALSLFHLQKKVTQSTIIMGNLAPEKTSPDYYAFEIANYILGGGGFSSLLTSEIRSNRGLAYSVGSFYRADVDYGVFGAHCMTKSTSTNQHCYSLHIMQRMRKQICKRLKQAKESLITALFFHTFALVDCSPEDGLEYDHLPADFQNSILLKFRRTWKDVHRAAGIYTS